MNRFSAYRTDTRDFLIIDQDGYAVAYENEVVRSTNERDAQEMAAALNDGADVSIFFESGGDYYGSPEHAAWGDAWYFQDCPGAW